MQRHERTDDGVEGCDRVAQAQTDAARRAVRLAGDEAQPAGGLGDRAEGRLVAHRSGLAVARDADDDEPRVGGDELLGVEVPRLEAPRPEVLDQDVAVEGQAAARSPGRPARAGPPRPTACRGTARDATANRCRSSVMPHFRSGSPRVGVLDLDDIRTEVGQHPPGERAGDERAQLEHADVRQRSGAAPLRVPQCWTWVQHMDPIRQGQGIPPHARHRPQ